jgi:hypothetical protein
MMKVVYKVTLPEREIYVWPGPNRHHRMVPSGCDVIMLGTQHLALDTRGGRSAG